MEKTYTVNEVLEIVINQLNAISVPRILNEQIGVPIDNAVRNLTAARDALNKPEENENADAE